MSCHTRLCTPAALGNVLTTALPAARRQNLFGLTFLAVPMKARQFCNGFAAYRPIDPMDHSLWELVGFPALVYIEPARDIVHSKKSMQRCWCF